MLFREMGVYTTRGMVEEFLEAADISLDDDEMTYENVLQVIAARRCTEGFSREDEIEEARDAWLELPRDAYGPIGKGKMKSLAQIDELAGGLLDFEGVNSVDNLRALMQILPPSDGDDDR